MYNRWYARRLISWREFFLKFWEDKSVTYSKSKKKIRKVSDLCCKNFLFCAIVAAFVSMLCVGNLALAGERLEGKDLYNKYCAPCHGEEGDGYGPLYGALYPKPRDFTKGQYKIRSNPSGSLPTDADLIHVISVGVHGTSMMPWDILDQGQIKSLLPLLKGFSEAWQYRKPEASVVLGPEMRSTQKTIARGRELYQQKECWKCHGETGNGDGPSSYDLEDEWEIPILPYDFTRAGKFKGGETNKDIYMRFTTGMNGTPMPSFASELSDEDRWCMVHFVKSLGEKKTTKEHAE
jgi:mono/diheme cytochrome c family protein